MKYKALLSDVDGTLVKYKKASGDKDIFPTQKVMDAIAVARKLIHIGVATSRPLFVMKDMFEAVPLSGPCIVSSGAQIYDATTKKVVYTRPIEPDDFWEVIKIIEPHYDKFFINEGHRDVDFSPDYEPQNALGIWIPNQTPEQADILVEEISKKIPGVSPQKIASHSPGKMDLDVVHVEATKAHGVIKVAEILDIDPKEIIGVGDGYNDFPLLMACGLRCAMGNAPEDLKAIADYIAPSVEEDGVADVIEKFVLKK